MIDTILEKILTIPGVLLAFTILGYSRAKMADYLGDKTPRFRGRLSFNPLNHMDLIGFVMLILFRFGWTKPVETNPNAYKRGYKDAYKVAIAPIIALLITGFIACMLWIGGSKLAFYFQGISFFETLFGIALSILSGIFSICVGLAVFQLIPIPGLAGFDILKAIKPSFVYKYGDYFYQYQTFIMLAIIFAGGRIISYPVSWIMNLYISIGTGIFF